MDRPLKRPWSDPRLDFGDLGEFGLFSLEAILEDVLCYEEGSEKIESLPAALVEGKTMFKEQKTKQGESILKCFYF